MPADEPNKNEPPTLAALADRSRRLCKKADEIVAEMREIEAQVKRAKAKAAPDHSTKLD